MKVLVIGHSLVVDTNRKVWDECAYLGNEVDLLIPNSWKSNLFKEYKFIFNPETDSHLNEIMANSVFFSGNGSAYFFNPFTLWKLLNSKKYDFIFIHQESWSLQLFWASLILRFGLNKKTKMTILATQNIYKKKYKLVEILERINMSRCNFIFGCNYATEKVFHHKGITKKWYYLPYSFDESIFYIEQKKIDKESIKLGYIGRLTEEKGIDDLLEVYYDLKEKFKVELVIAGGGPLESKVHDSRGIKYLGKIKHQEVRKFYEEVNILLLPSKTRSFWKEQFGRVIIEAAASRLSVVGSDSGSIPEVMKSLEMPYCYNEKSIDDFREKLKNCIEAFMDDSIKKQLDRSQELSMKVFSHQAVAKYIMDTVKNE